MPKGKKNIRVNEYEDMIYLNISFRSKHCSVLLTETRKLRHKEKFNNCLKSEQLFRNFKEFNIAQTNLLTPFRKLGIALKF